MRMSTAARLADACFTTSSAKGVRTRVAWASAAPGLANTVTRRSLKAAEVRLRCATRSSVSAPAGARYSSGVKRSRFW